MNFDLYFEKIKNNNKDFFNEVETQIKVIFKKYAGMMIDGAYTISKKNIEKEMFAAFDFINEIDIDVDLKSNHFRLNLILKPRTPLYLENLDFIIDCNKDKYSISIANLVIVNKHENKLYLIDDMPYILTKQQNYIDFNSKTVTQLNADNKNKEYLMLQNFIQIDQEIMIDILMNYNKSNKEMYKLLTDSNTLPVQYSFPIHKIKLN